MSAHTPGPWHVLPSPSNPCGWYIVDVPADKVGRHTAQICANHLDARYYPSERSLADARLIAAAPDLLDAVKLALSRAECDLRLWPLKDEGSTEHQSLMVAAAKLRAALAKAEGAA